MCTIYRFVASSFMSICCNLLRLCENNPAPTSSTSDNAVCTTTSPRCNSEAPPLVVRDPVRRASAGSAFAAIHAGAMPNRIPVTSDNPNANPSTSGDGLASIGTFFAPGNASSSSIRVPAYATASPAIPPMPASSNSPSATAAQSAPASRPAPSERNLRLPPHAPHQQQVRNIRARNQQHQPGDPHQQPQIRLIFLLHALDSRRRPASAQHVPSPAAACHRR